MRIYTQRDSFIRHVMNPLGQYLCHRWEAEGHVTIKQALRAAGMTPRQFNLLSFGDRDFRESTIRRAVDSFGGTMAEYYSRSWVPTFDTPDGMVFEVDGDPRGGRVRPRFNRGRPGCRTRQLDPPAADAGVHPGQGGETAGGLTGTPAACTT
jgi:hypothetical protein